MCVGRRFKTAAKHLVRRGSFPGVLRLGRYCQVRTDIGRLLLRCKQASASTCTRFVCGPSARPTKTGRIWVSYLDDLRTIMHQALPRTMQDRHENNFLRPMNIDIIDLRIFYYTLDIKFPITSVSVGYSPIKFNYITYMYAFHLNKHRNI